VKEDVRDHKFIQRGSNGLYLELEEQGKVDDSGKRRQELGRATMNRVGPNFEPKTAEPMHERDPGRKRPFQFSRLGQKVRR